MKSTLYDTEIISAPSILGLKPGGVERLAASLLDCGLAAAIGCRNEITHVPTLNALYNYDRDPETNCLNPKQTRDFSLQLNSALSTTLNSRRFALVLGGDCSILLGIMPALKSKGSYALVFLDAHADFYAPGQSVTGELADMDLAIITGKGPDLLTNMNNLRPYVREEHVVHIGQRDVEETKKYGSRDIRESRIKCHSLEDLRKAGVELTLSQVLLYCNNLKVDGLWIHYDTDVLSDAINPAVDYRLPGGLLFGEVEYLIGNLLKTGSVAGISVTIFNPELDRNNLIAKQLTESIGRAFNLARNEDQETFTKEKDR